MIQPLPETKEGTLSLAAYKKIKDFSKDSDILAIGPGLTQNKSTQALIRKVVSGINEPMVIDADGLNALISCLDILRTAGDGRRPTVLTPHPGEMARLLGISIAKVQNNRKNITKKFAKDYRVIVVLKGHNTVVADYKNNLYINKTGNPGMATAGSGDVLTGMITALLGQGLDTFNAAKYAVYLHGLAGDLAAKEKTQLGMIASDIIDKIPEAIKISA
jgi:NAD(P)H-hydrate epimerase